MQSSSSDFNNKIANHLDRPSKKTLLQLDASLQEQCPEKFEKLQKQRDERTELQLGRIVPHPTIEYYERLLAEEYAEKNADRLCEKSRPALIHLMFQYTEEVTQTRFEASALNTVINNVDNVLDNLTGDLDDDAFESMYELEKGSKVIEMFTETKLIQPELRVVVKKVTNLHRVTLSDKKILRASVQCTIQDKRRKKTKEKSLKQDVDLINRARFYHVFIFRGASLKKWSDYTLTLSVKVETEDSKKSSYVVLSPEKCIFQEHNEAESYCTNDSAFWKKFLENPDGMVNAKVPLKLKSNKDQKNVNEILDDEEKREKKSKFQKMFRLKNSDQTSPTENEEVQRDVDTQAIDVEEKEEKSKEGKKLSFSSFFKSKNDESKVKLEKKTDKKYEKIDEYDDIMMVKKEKKSVFKMPNFKKLILGKPKVSRTKEGEDMKVVEESKTVVEEDQSGNDGTDVKTLDISEENKSLSAAASEKQLGVVDGEHEVTNNEVSTTTELDEEESAALDETERRSWKNEDVSCEDNNIEIHTVKNILPTDDEEDKETNGQADDIEPNPTDSVTSGEITTATEEILKESEIVKANSVGKNPKQSKLSFP